jgi:hypothetical protein
MTHPLTKPCCRADCDRLVVRRRGESAGDWRKRPHCGIGCANKTRAEKRLARIVPPPRRHCVGCGDQLVREYGESASRFAERKSCGAPRCKEAAHAAGMARVRQATSTAINPCDVCGKPTAGRAICHSCAARGIKAPKPKAKLAPSVPLGPTWRVYHTGVALPEGDPVAAEIRRMVQAGIAVTTIRRGQGGELEYLCKARAG